jgi:hypothetical protein
MKMSVKRKFLCLIIIYLCCFQAYRIVLLPQLGGKCLVAFRGYIFDRITAQVYDAPLDSHIFKNGFCPFLQP